MKKTITLSVLFLIICSNGLLGQNKSKIKPAFITFQYGGQFGFFKNNQSTLLKENARSQTNWANGNAAAIQVVAINDKKLYLIGWELMSLKYRYRAIAPPDLGATSWFVDYTNTTSFIELGYGQIVKQGKTPSNISYIYFGTSNGVFANKYVEVKNTAPSSKEISDFFNSRTNSKFVSMAKFGFATKTSFKKLDLGISLNFYIYRYMTRINKEFGGTPNGLGFQVGIFHYLL